MMADHHHLPLFIQLLKAGRQASHGEQQRAIDMADAEFPGFTHIQQQWFLLLQIRVQLAC